MPRITRTRRRFRPARARDRLQRFLQSRCFICLHAPNDFPSKRLPCCGQYVHEDCLLQAFQYATPDMRDRCSHCRGLLTSYNHSEAVPVGPNLFCFDHVRYPPPPAPPSDPDWRFNYFGIPPEDSDDIFLNPPIPSPPPGWAESRRQ